jgi:hypothetical protein
MPGRSPRFDTCACIFVKSSACYCNVTYAHMHIYTYIYIHHHKRVSCAAQGTPSFQYSIESTYIQVSHTHTKVRFDRYLSTVAQGIPPFQYNAQAVSNIANAFGKVSVHIVYRKYTHTFEIHARIIRAHVHTHVRTHMVHTFTYIRAYKICIFAEHTFMHMYVAPAHTHTYRAFRHSAQRHVSIHT